MRITTIAYATILGLGLFSCKKPAVGNGGDFYAPQKQDIKETYANMAFAVYTDSYNTAVSLQTAINIFIATPNQQNLDNAKQAWLTAREIYGQSEVFRFVDGPIDNPADGPEGLINAWPMDEAYVDYVQGNASAGIINNVAQYPVIDETTIITANEFGGETNISCGYHAIEFLLWGQDLSSTGPGNRSYLDYVVGGGTASNELRRAQYLAACADILVQALDQVRTDWDPADPNSYYHTFVEMDNKLALRKMFNSMKVLSGFELAGERIYVAYQNSDQEDEHSCFSDNTHRDIYLNAKGIQNLYFGIYTSPYGNSVQGYSIAELAHLMNLEEADEMDTRFQTTMSLIGQMYTPFDQAIVLPAERPKVYDVVVSLEAESELLVDIAGEFDIIF